MEWAYYLALFIFGLCFGSFFNVVGMRLPNNESINKPRSHCTSCGHILKWYELIPVLSFLIQRGRCLECQAKLSYFYPFIELSTAILFVVSYYSFGFTFEFLIALTLVSLCMIVIVSDLSYLIIPDSFIIIPAIIIIILNFLNKGLIYGLTHLFYGMLSFIFMYLIMLLGNKLFHKESMGGADIKLMFISGLALDPMLTIIVIFLASFIALPVAFFLLLKNKEHVVPFGPFITISLLIVYFLKMNIQDIFQNILNFF